MELLVQYLDVFNKISRRAFLFKTGWFSFFLPLIGCLPRNALPSGNIGSPLDGLVNIKPPSAGPPKASDVIMRSMGIHPHNQNDPHDTMRALRNFHANCLEWTYIEDINFIQKVKRFGQLFVVDWSNKAKPFKLELDPDRTAR